MSPRRENGLADDVAEPAAVEQNQQQYDDDDRCSIEAEAVFRFHVKLPLLSSARLNWFWNRWAKRLIGIGSTAYRTIRFMVAAAIGRARSCCQACASTLATRLP